MAYAPGQPWDKEMSYSSGQTCTYNGLPYVWYHPTLSSTPNKKPNVEEVEFEAVDGASVVKRLERGWVLADQTFNIGGGGLVFAQYGDIKSFQRIVRGIDPAVDPVGISSPFLYHSNLYSSWWQRADNKFEYSRQFYGFLSMSWEYGLANEDATPPVDATNGNPNVAALPTSPLYTFSPQFFFPSLPFAEIEAVTSSSANIKVYFTIAENMFYEPTFINEFNRDAAYTLTIRESLDSDPYVIEGTINSGPFRDGFSLKSTSQVKTHPVSVGAGFSADFKVGAITPRFDA
jgi:hypothetical protein